MNQLVVVRLVTGDDVVGYLVSEDTDQIELDEALAIRHVYEKEGSYPSVYLVKYMVYTDGYSVKFKQNQVLSIFNDPIEALRNYHKRTIQKIKSLREDNPAKYDEEMMTAILEKIMTKTIQ